MSYRPIIISAPCVKMRSRGDCRSSMSMPFADIVGLLQLLRNYFKERKKWHNLKKLLLHSFAQVVPRSNLSAIETD